MQKEQREKRDRKEKRRPHPLGAQSETRCQKTSSVAGARGIARPRARAADDLSAQGSGLCARQAKGSSHAPEIPTPTPAVNLRFDIDACKLALMYSTSSRNGNRHF